MYNPSEKGFKKLLLSIIILLGLWSSRNFLLLCFLNFEKKINRVRFDLGEWSWIKRLTAENF